MRVFRKLVLAIAAGATLSGCLFSVPMPLAPGAEQVRVTRDSSLVASCTPVGNIDARIGVELADSDRFRAMQNQAVGLGGNVVLDTSLGGPAMGVIYRCGQIASPAAH